MSDSERYVPPPPPYEHSLQHDQKVTEVQVLLSDVPKGSPFLSEEKDSKHSRILSDKTLGDIAIHTVPGISKGPARPVSGKLRASRPLPPSPAGTPSRGLGNKYGSIADIESFAAQNDHAAEPHAPVPPPFSAIGPPLDEAPYRQSMLHPNTSVHPTPFHYPSQPSYDTSRRNSDGRWLTSAYPPMEPSAETFRRSTHSSSQSPSYAMPRDDTFRTRLAFDPSVAYSDSQAHTRTALQAQQGVAASLYSSSVSPHLRPDSITISGSRPYAPPRPALWSTEALRLDKTDMRSVRSPASTYSSSPASLYTPRPRTQSGYEQRWATSESDITRDVYRS